MLTTKNRPLRNRSLRERLFNRYLCYYNWIGYKIWRNCRQIRFAFLTLISSVSMFLSSSGLKPALAEDDSDGGGGLCAGFLCGAINKIVTTPPYDSNSEIVFAVFIGLQAVIVAFLAWRVVKVIQAREAGEEYQSIVSSSVLIVVALLVINYLADYVMGVSSVES